MLNPRAAALEESISLILRESLSVEVPSLDADLIALGTLDSLMLVDLLVRIEEMTGVMLSIESIDLADLRSVRSIGSLLHRRMGTS
jgi:acyl carrier protein